jgi:pyruvate,water dikinase
MLVLPTSTSHFACSEAGGKGYNLYRITQLGLPVPEWAVLGKSIYNDFLENSGLLPLINEHLNAFSNKGISAEKASQCISDLIVNASLSDEILALVEKAYTYIGNEHMISIRSSAADEDSLAYSFAGQLSSFLYVDGVEDAARYLQACWASGFTERSLIYRQQNNIGLDRIGIAVIFQRMLDPSSSGVLFTCDPVSQSLTHYLISGVYGVGEGLVSGSLDADTYWLSAETGETSKQTIVEKKKAFSRSGSGECKVVDISEDQALKPCLSEQQTKTIYQLGRALFDYYSIPQDVEWAIENDEVYILQTRPVTTLKNNLSGFPNLWDNSNIVESYGGITSPLSFTFALENYKNVYIQFCEILGVPRSVVKEMEYYLGNMLGSINGRVFYNLYNWYKLVGVLPGFQQNKQFMETMMGVGEQLSSEITERIKPHPSWDTPIGKFRKFKTGIAFLYYHFRIQTIVDRFLGNFRHHYDLFRQKDYSRMTSDQVFEEYLAMNRVMLDHWKAPIINDFLCMVHFGLLKKLTTKWLADLDENIQNDLLAGEGNIESAEPTKTLIRYAGDVAANPALRTLIENTPEYLLLERLNQSEFQSFYQKILDYIDRYGFRCMSEMKLEEKDLFTDPTFLFVCLKNYLRADITHLEEYEKREKAMRNAAEQAIEKKLGGWRKWCYLWSLKHARKAVKNRENTRFARTRAYGIARSMFQSMGNFFTSQNILTHPDDVFFLTLQEIYGIHQGTLPVYDLKAIVLLRKTRFQQYEDAEPKIRFQTRGPVYWHNDFFDTPDSPDLEPGADYDLKGLACCPGIVEGVVRVIHSPKESLHLDGEILVAKHTDPGWVPLFPSVSGLLVERGSLLSHSAIVAREMGIPAIVGIKGLMTTLESGMTVRFDGKTGTIKILHQPDDAEG